MFSKNSANTTPIPKMRETSSPQATGHNNILEGTVIEGEIVSEGNLRIDGRVKGKVTAKGRLVIGSKGFIEGEVFCGNADIEGTLEGVINVTDLLSLKSTAKIVGEIHTNKLSIEPGANFSGTSNMGGIVKDLKNSPKLSNTLINDDPSKRPENKIQEPKFSVK